MALAKQSRRHRSSSDPFSDPTTISYSSYGVPTLAKNPPAQSRRTAPTPPPKPPKTAPGRYQPSPMASKDDPANAIQEVVTVRRVDQAPRTRTGHSQPQAASSNSRSAPGQPRRSLSQDSGVPPMTTSDKAKAAHRKPPTKRGSSHADVIDRLDFSGVGPMFHHDGPFDACAPSRNRHRTKAPMLAWSAEHEEDKRALAHAREIPPSSYASPYPSPGVYVPYEAPKKKRDAIAEAWGIHEPEPYEDFSAGGGGGYSTHSGADYGSAAPPSRSSNGAAPRKSKDAREAREQYQQYLNEGATPQLRRQQTKRTALPPPQPIFVPEGDIDVNPANAGSSPPSSPGAPKRSRSIMHRIRKMRDAPNVPVGYGDFGNGDNAGGYERDPSPSSSAENSAATTSQAHGPGSRPTHRTQNSFLGRLGRGANGASKEGTSPTSETSDNFVYVENQGAPREKEKSLPATPGVKGGTPPGEYNGDYFSSPSGGGLGRKTSLLKKMKGVVKGAK
ncbi:hypothetical protein QCA50_001939 [Cerrena zonata]|uniref:Uncharacterized protein n=1 Tax=Cerrena zonata TaxID=2478898 RepID=A0AAW0GPW0_9APHY